MKVLLKPIGDLRDYLGREPQELLLADNAILQDLLNAISERWGESLPPYLWDSGKKKFRGPVYFVVDNKVIRDLNTPLQDGVEVILLKALAGGSGARA